MGVEKLQTLKLSISIPTPRPLQFAYKAKRGTEDAVACLHHLLLQRLHSGDSTRILFMVSTPSCLIQPFHNVLADRLEVVWVGTMNN